MSSKKWKSFEEARADVEAYNKNEHPMAKVKLVSVKIMGFKSCPAPSWEPDVEHRVRVLDNDRAIIEKRLRGGEWVETSLEAPVL